MITEDDEWSRIESEIKRQAAQAKVTDEQGRPMTYWGGKALEQQAEPCIGKDPRCPCQDNDACHYKDCGGTKARPVPPAQPAQRKPLTDKQILADETLRYYFGQNGGAGPVSKQGRKVVDAIEAAHGIKEQP